MPIIFDDVLSFKIPWPSHSGSETTASMWAASATAKKPVRLIRALRLRDIAISLLKEFGVWEPIQLGNGRSLKVLQFQMGNISMILSTPFQKLPNKNGDESMKYVAALNGIKRTDLLPYGLDVFSPKKVMNITWDTNGACELIAFRPGPWEAELEVLAQARAN